MGVSPTPPAERRCGTKAGAAAAFRRILEAAKTFSGLPSCRYLNSDARRAATSLKRWCATPRRRRRARLATAPSCTRSCRLLRRFRNRHSVQSQVQPHSTRCPRAVRAAATPAARAPASSDGCRRLILQFEFPLGRGAGLEVHRGQRGDFHFIADFLQVVSLDWRLPSRFEFAGHFGAGDAFEPGA